MEDQQEQQTREIGASPPATTSTPTLVTPPPATSPESPEAMVSALPVPMADMPGMPTLRAGDAIPAVHSSAPAAAGSSRSSVALVVAAACVVAAASAAAGMALVHGDWASGGIAGGLASLVVATLWLVGTALWARRAIREQASRRVVRGILLGLAVVLVFGALGVSGLRASTPLHLAQAQADETNQDWEGALTEYALSGARAPGSRDLARVYGEWGDALAQQGQYARAVQRYFIVLYTFTGVPDARQGAVDGLWHAYSLWLAESGSATAYSAIIHDIHVGGQAAWCFGPCPATAALLEAQARFQYGQQLDRQQQYSLAIPFFETVATTAPHSAYVPGAHLAAAADYYAIAQPYLGGTACSQARGPYLLLAKNYADTPWGAKARAALAQPVAVSGAITGYPTNPAPTVYLSVHIDGTTVFSDDYSTGLDGKGHFTFAQVKPGRYNLSAAFADGSGRSWHNATTGDPYFVTVSPLCPLGLGQFAW